MSEAERQLEHGPEHQVAPLELFFDLVLVVPTRAALYRALRLSLRYEKQAPTGQERVHVRLELCRGGGRI